MVLDIDEKNLKNGVLGLVVALVEIIKEALRLQALKRMEGGSLTEEEAGGGPDGPGRLIEKIKVEMGITKSVQAVRDSLDRVVDKVSNTEGFSIRLVGPLPPYSFC